MTVLISAYKSNGRCVGRCDVKCHNAVTPASKCQCICGGINHGIGSKQAVANQTERWEEICSLSPELKLVNMPVQMSFFPAKA